MARKNTECYNKECKRDQSTQVDEDTGIEPRAADENEEENIQRPFQQQRVVERIHIEGNTMYLSTPATISASNASDTPDLLLMRFFESRDHSKAAPSMKGRNRGNTANEQVRRRVMKQKRVALRLLLVWHSLLDRPG